MAISADWSDQSFIDTQEPLRHSCATHMVQNGAPLRHVQELLGHNSIETTQIYTQLTITDLKDAHGRFHPREQQPVE